MVKNKSEDTPMIRQYYAAKAQYPDTIMLFRVGDFYEAYGEDAEIISKVMGIVLTKRANGDKGFISMAGVPHHAIGMYLPKLIHAGHKAAICDQLEDPALCGNKLVKRGVTEVITPGIAFSDELLTQKENNFLAGIYIEKEECGIAFLDVSTGTFQIAQGSLDYAGALLSSLSPKELVVQRGYEKGIKAKWGDYYCTSLDEWAFVYEAAEEKLKRQLSVQSLKGFAVEMSPLGICAAGAVLVYLEQTQHSGLKNLCSVSRIDEGENVWMDKFTIRNLELFASNSGADGVALVDVLDRCSSPMGARLLRNWIALPVKDLKELEKRHDIVGCLSDNPEALTELENLLGKLGDLERIISRAATGKILPRETLQLSRSLKQIRPIRHLCSSTGVEALDGLVGGLKDCSELAGKIKSTLLENAAAAIGKGDVIASGVDSKLDELRKISRGGKDYLLQMQKREIDRTGISSLKIGYNNVFGYYIEVRNIFKDKIPHDWVRKQTLVSAERYITDELKQYEEQILSAEDSILKIEAQIYASLVERIQKDIAIIQKNGRILAKLDVLACFARIASERNYCRPKMDKSLVLDIKDGRHPVIETLMAPGEEYIPNDVELDNKKQQIIILTGPNMAGKSALLRQTALIVLMAQIGSFVPAREARIGYFDKIFTRVGATDNISRGESTFMVEMLETSMIMHNLSDRSLVLLDEIGRGTSTYDGMSIARALVEYIHEYGHGAKTLFATHYHELNDLEGIFQRVRNYHIAVKEVGKDVIFLRKMQEGGVAHSFGIHVARLAGMPREIIDSAERTLKALETGDQLPVMRAVETPAGTLQGDGSMQLSFFQLDDPALESIRDSLKAADLNNMTPMQAFDLLRSMKQELGI